jgi:heptosyltransferase-2
LKKILIIQTASIGDVILATPVLEKLHYHYPDAELDFLLKKGNERLFDGHPFLHTLLIWDKSKDKYKNFKKLIKEIRENKYDSVINIQRFASSGLITILSGAKLKVGFNKNPFSPFFNIRIKHTIHNGEIHETERNINLIKRFTDDTLFPVKLYPLQRDYAKMSQFKTAKYITVSPASLWFTKQYPEEKWIEFIKDIDEDIRVYFLGSENDSELCNSIINKSGHSNSMNLAGKLSFLESTALMRDAVMNFMNDSAPLHLASAVNAKITAIFCSTVPSFGFGPMSEDSIIVQTKEKLKCKPCGLHGLKDCPEDHFKCAMTIDKNELLKRIE